MKKIIYLLMGLVLFNCKVQAQTYDTTQYYGKMNYVFHHVDKSQVSTGLLRDYGIEFLNLDNYTGTVLHDSNFVALDEWRMLYTSLYSSQINSNANMLYLDTVNRLINKYNYTDSAISFIGLHYNYDKLKDYTLTNNLMTVSNEQLYDVSGRPESPYENKTLFAIAPIRQAAFTGSNSFVFRPQLFLSNTGKTISAIAYKKQGAGSYQTIAFNTPFTISYDSVGFYNLDIKITYTDNSIVYGHTKIVVYENPNNVGARYGTGSTPATNEPVTGTIKQYLGVSAQGDITVDLAANNTTGQIRKPLIVVEGFDPNGDFDFNQFVRSIDRNSNTGATITLNTGLDDINEYDLIFLNWANSTDYIQRNAYLLERVIEIVNTRKTTWNGVRQQNVIIGMSMGGLVARYALRDMELNSQNHETRLFISHDAPHWGANIPVALQMAVQQLGPWKIPNVGGAFPWIQFVDMMPKVADALDMFNSPAAKQMLIQRYTLTPPLTTPVADNSVHDNFLNELNTMGWPVNSRNVTLANGSCNGNLHFADNSTIFTIDGARPMTYFGGLWRSFLISLAGVVGVTGSGGMFDFPLSLFSTRNSIGLDFKIRAVPFSGTQEIYRGDIYSKKTLLWLINVKTYFVKCRVSSNTGMLALDNAPGGAYDIREFGIDEDDIESQLPSFFAGYINAQILEDRFCFIPTVSSLALANPATIYRSAVCNTIACIRPSAVADFFAPQANELHISYTQPATNWLLSTQDAAVNCNRICAQNLSIAGPDIICNTSTNYSILGLPSGATVSWSASPSGLVTINSPNATQTTITKVGNGIITLNAFINTSCGGSPVLISRNIVVGTPVIGSNSPLLMPWTGNPNTYNNVCNYQNTYTNMPVPGATSVLWERPAASPSNTNWNQIGNNINFYFWAVGQTAIFKLTASNGCGNTIQSFGFKSINCGGGGGDCFQYNVSPNPAKTSLKIIVPNIPPPCLEKTNVSNETYALRSFSQLKIYDERGYIKKVLKFNKSKEAVINLIGFKAGIYYIEISDGDYMEKHKIIITE